ncbi:membrane protein implicated in regulation of membrane protease activity [Nocardioides ginsengisegetis]|uniref:Membrane protein implicated in regulation of membrane protease activity n=1 Tax=Nocardioides ginsengisegetis TaxID=661491 RepID=A0A7W3P9J5_9ACTN|nr:NfeD family protein [Nocardioides ginsengisegetis]MBA8803504.1 membrane protein implicated in regulation of membrane protease activity [Nocardioides ginsengisegetis]
MEWFRDHMWETWAALAVLLGLAELFSLDLILIMLAVGALAGLLTAALSAPVVAQMLVAAASAVAMLALVRPELVKKLHGGPELRLGHGKLVGQQGVVTELVTALEPGRIKLAGEIWSAAPYDETLTIAPGETVEVLQIRGATAYVHPIPKLES